MLNIKILCVGKLKEKFYSDAANEYIKRLSAYCKLEVLEIAQDKQQSLEKERLAIEAKIPSGAMLVALCIEGQAFDSQMLSQLLDGCALCGTSRLCFVIGGSVGLHEHLKAKADIKLSMSQMTFPHNLARVMLLEQLYRAFNIADGGKYHK
ncbi:MAG: 23S rRNA (pseudouridine(1915)-N(3))-methyltransferase RlmH [Oscillospiraceae bacterium]|nr:23S rRNA (pseudouridine(1915)-N(3))-methyltransferase RlmH [Oscillospiraceae bacterium]